MEYTLGMYNNNSTENPHELLKCIIARLSAIVD